MDKLKLIMAFLYRKEGGKTLRDSKMAFLLSMELRWFTHSEAKKVVERAIERELITKTPEGYRASFSWEEVTVPTSFKPNLEEVLKAIPETKGNLNSEKKEEHKDVEFQEEGQRDKGTVEGENKSEGPSSSGKVEAKIPSKKDLKDNFFVEILDSLLKDHGLKEDEKRQFLERAEKAGKKFHILPEASLLVAATESGIDIRNDIILRVKDHIKGVSKRKSE